MTGIAPWWWVLIKQHFVPRRANAPPSTPNPKLGWAVSDRVQLDSPILVRRARGERPNKILIYELLRLSLRFKLRTFPFACLSLDVVSYVVSAHGFVGVF